MQFDEVLGLTTRAGETVIQPFGVAARDVGDGVADIETHGGDLDTGCDTALAAPGFGTLAGFCEATNRSHLSLGVAHPDIVGRHADQAVQDGVAEQAQDVVDVVGFAPSHDFVATIMPIATDREPGLSSTATGRDVAVS